MMGIPKTIAIYVCLADPTATPFLQPDGSVLVELQKALYGLPESGTLWHELMTGILGRIGYTQCPGDSCLWKRFCPSGNVSLILLYVDDVMHLYKGEKIKESLYQNLLAARLPPLTMSYLGPKSSVSFLGLHIEQFEDGHLFISQPGYTASIIAKYGDDKTSPASLPSNFCNRSVSTEEVVELDDAGKHDYLQLCMIIAWLVRTRPDLAAAVSYKQTKCQSSRKIDRKDLQHVVSYLAGTPNMGISIRVKDLDPKLWIDAALAVHDDRATSGSSESELFSLAIYLGENIK
jgi:hypothetical protein